MASTKAPPTGRYQVTQPRPAQPVQPPAFPGCTPVHLPRTEIERFEGRGIAVAEGFPADAAAFAAASEQLLLAAALACADEQAFNDLLVRHAD